MVALLHVVGVHGLYDYNVLTAHAGTNPHSFVYRVNQMKEIIPLIMIQVSVPAKYCHAVNQPHPHFLDLVMYYT